MNKNTPNPLVKSSSSPAFCVDSNDNLRIKGYEFEISQLQVQLEYKDKLIDILREQILQLQLQLQQLTK